MFDFLFKPKSTHHRQLVAGGALLLDVRTPEEFHGGHLEGAKNIPVQELAARLREVGDVKRPVVVYCRSGGRSSTAAQLLRGHGYQVTDIGGMHNW
ncbi:MAG: Thiosulfate sulfurtransferase GlpE [Myxococcota bacterium]|nr:Thiosulfate sulfurtransferase GlpE [Myxococcota bacterium]